MLEPSASATCPCSRPGGRRLVGVLDDIDLMASERRAPVPAASQNRAGAARTRGRRRRGRPGCPRPWIGRPRRRHGPRTRSAASSRSIHDTVTRRLIELAHDELGRPPVPTRGSRWAAFAGREPFPSSDVDWRARVGTGRTDDEELRRQLNAKRRARAGGRRGQRVQARPGRARSRPSGCSHGRSSEWENAARARGSRTRTRGRGLECCSRSSSRAAPVWGIDRPPPSRLFPGRSHPRPATTRCSGRTGPPRPSPSGRRRASYATSSCTRAAERKGGARHQARADCWPIESLARWARPGRGASERRRPQARLKAAQEARGRSTPGDAATLREGVRAGLRSSAWSTRWNSSAPAKPPDNLISQKDLTPLQPETALQVGVPRGSRSPSGAIGMKLGLSGR